jgi:hypothetical protein
MIGTPTKNLLIWSGLAGLVGALLVGTGEFLLQFSPDGGYEDAEYTWLALISLERMKAGHFLAILSAPLYLIGYWHLTQMLKPAGLWPARVVGYLGGYSFMVAVVWIGQRALLGLVAHEIADGSAQPELLHAMAALNEPLVNVLRVAILIISAIWIVQIVRGQSRYPRWMAIFSPAALLVSIFALYGFAPYLGTWILPTAMNTAHFVLFALSTWVAAKAQ